MRNRNGRMPIRTKEGGRILRALLVPILLLTAPCARADGVGGAGSSQPPQLGSASEHSRPKRVAVYVYAGIDESELAPYARRALQEMEQVGSNDNLDIVVELDDDRGWVDGRYHLEKHASPPAAPAVFQTPPISVSSEPDSGTRERLAAFLSWALTAYPGQQSYLVILGHSWGWRGVIQDFDVPGGAPGANSMIPVYELRAALEDAVRLRGRPFDAIVLDACITGVAEVAYELKDVAYALMASELETPLSSFPYDRVLQLLASGSHATDDVLAFWVRDYVTAYARGGRHAFRRPHQQHRLSAPAAGRLTPVERQFFAATAVAVRLGQMDRFRRRMDNLATELEAVGFRDRVLNGTDFLADFVDLDFNADVYDFLLHVERAPGEMRPSIQRKSKAVRALFDYPDDGLSSTFRVNQIPVKAGEDLWVDVQADEMAEPGKALCYALSAFEFMNKQYAKKEHDCDAKPEEVDWQGVYRELPLIVQRDSQPFLRLHLDTTAAQSVLPLRVRMPGAQRFFYKVGESGWKRFELGADFVVHDHFPKGSLLIAEGHDNGAYNIHGLGIFLRTIIDDEVPRAVDPSGTIRNEQYYDLLRWSRESRWSALVFGPRLGRSGKP